MIKKLIFASYIIAAALLAFSGCKTMEKAETAPFELRVNCGETEPYTDEAGNTWLADQYMDDDVDWGTLYGMTIRRGDLTITDTNAPEIYLTERYGMDAYEFNVPKGKYTVRLHFAETFEGITGEGERIFSVTINGKTVIEDMDLFKESGFAKPVVKEFKGVKAKNGQIIVGFIPDIENPEINGIEILSE